ncbi:MAG: HNH endonuclease [Actinobacteria bacterium]|nr:HNH endonuclease [Actinomycetota bacterium]
MITKAMKDKLAKRDPYCVHCGEDAELVIHHRKNRGMGGSKKLDNMSNLLRICPWYNTFIESSATAADVAREHGHKLRQWDDFDTPILDECTGIWYVLDDVGNKNQVPPPVEENVGLF